MAWWVRVFVLIPFAAGCGDSSPKAKVTGRLTLDGVPVERAQVYLVAKPQPLPMRSRTAATFTADVVDGWFEIPRQFGPPPGEYDVVVQPLDPEFEDVLQKRDDKGGNPLAERNQFLAAVARKGPIQVELTGDSEIELDIALTSR
jgi:hypothetical protein